MKADFKSKSRSNSHQTNFFGKSEVSHSFFKPALIQPDLTINEPGDKYEQEADAMADRVMRMSENTAPTPPEEEQSIQTMPISRLQRQKMSEEEEVQAMPIQRKCAGCEQEEKLQRQETGEEEALQTMPLMRKSKGGGYSASPQLTNQLSQSKGGGSSLPKSTLTQMNQAFGMDFTHVRIHNDSQAQEMSQGIQAKAFTHGSDIYFNQGQYQPESSSGKKLLAHELTHVVQQGGKQEIRGFIYRDCLPERGGDLWYEVRRDAERRRRALIRRGLCREENCRIERFDPSGPPEVGYRVVICTTTSSEGDTSDSSSPSTQDQDQPDPTSQGTSGTQTIDFVLTLDDGPHIAPLGTGRNRTENVLNVLQSRGIRAIFFIQTGVSHRGASRIGRLLTQRMARDGHTVAIHTGGSRDHELHTQAQAQGRLSSELSDAFTYIRDQGGSTPRFVRPPTGRSSTAVRATYASLGLTNLLWDIDGDQGRNLSSVALRLRLIRELRRANAGGWRGTTPLAPKLVVLYHDIQQGTSENIANLIDEIIRQTPIISGNTRRARIVAP